MVGADFHGFGRLDHDGSAFVQPFVVPFVPRLQLSGLLQLSGGFVRGLRAPFILEITPFRFQVFSL